MVASHQDLLSCAIAKWKALDEVVLSGIRPNNTGTHWTMDIKGKYATPAIGGYIYQLVGAVATALSLDAGVRRR